MKGTFVICDIGCFWFWQYNNCGKGTRQGVKAFSWVTKLEKFRFAKLEKSLELLWDFVHSFILVELSHKMFSSY